MPACNSRRIMRGSEHAGPMVQTILEWRKAMNSREREFTTFRAPPAEDLRFIISMRQIP
jgi:hypothetical protein